MGRIGNSHVHAEAPSAHSSENGWAPDGPRSVCVTVCWLCSFFVRARLLTGCKSTIRFERTGTNRATHFMRLLCTKPAVTASSKQWYAKLAVSARSKLAGPQYLLLARCVWRHNDILMHRPCGFQSRSQYRSALLLPGTSPTSSKTGSRVCLALLRIHVDMEV